MDFFVKTRYSYPSEKGAFSFIFLSLLLLIFCFFIFLISGSSFEQVKVMAVQESLQSYFKPSSAYKTLFQPSFIPNAFISLNRNLFTTLFPDAKLEQNQTGHVLQAQIPAKELFIPFQDTILADQMPFLEKLASFLKQKDGHFSYDLDFIAYVDLSADENYPIFSNLATRRAQKIAETLINLGVLPEQISVGFKRGNANVVSFTLRAVPKGGAA